MAWQSNSNNHSEKPTLASNPHNPNSAAYLAYPVKHVVSSLYRRMTEPPDVPVNRLLDAPTITRSSHSSTSPTPRRASPFQPPPLSPLTLQHALSERAANQLLLTHSLAEEIRLLVPPRLQLLTSWRLAFSLDNHGSSLATLYDHCEKITGSLGSSQRGGYILVVRDASSSADSGSVFGAYLTDAPKPNPHYYGTGECFLWRASMLPSLRTLSAQLSPVPGRDNSNSISEDLLELAGLPPPPSADTTHAQRTTTVRGDRRASSSASQSQKPHHHSSGSRTISPTLAMAGLSTSTLPPQPLSSPTTTGTSTPEPDRIRFKAFPYSGINDFMIYCQPDFLSVGGGDGHYGLWLDDQLDRGISESCPTFGNEPLSDEDGYGGNGGGGGGVGHGKKGRFEVVGCEVWHVGAEGS